MYNIVCCFNYLRSANVMHRDVKKNNILVDPDTLEVRICDFGFARTDPEPIPNFILSEYQVNQKGVLPQVTGHRAGQRRRVSNRIIVRPYRPPEVFLCQREYHATVDDWSLGCVLAELAYTHAGILSPNNLYFDPDSKSPINYLEDEN